MRGVEPSVQYIMVINYTATVHIFGRADTRRIETLHFQNLPKLANMQLIVVMLCLTNFSLSSLSHSLRAAPLYSNHYSNCYLVIDHSHWGWRELVSFFDLFAHTQLA